MPKSSYQNGINRQWLRKLPTDYYFPEFAHLSEQAILQGEVFWANGTSGNPGGGYDNYRIFGYCGQYDEMRIKHDMVCSDLRTTITNNLSYWHFTRNLPDNTALNSTFITCTPTKAPFAVNTILELVVNVQNNLIVTRPLPAIAEPGLIDHF